MIALTSEQLSERRAELAQVEEQIRSLGRRRSVLRSEILSGYAAPAKGVPAEQLTLDTATTTTTATPTPEAPVQPPEASEPAAETDSAKLDSTLFRPSKHPEHLLPTLTSKGKRAVLRMLQEAPGGRLPEEEIQSRLGLPNVPMPSECFYQSGDWALKEAPKKAQPPRTKTAKKPSKKPAKPSKPAPKAAKTKATKPKPVATAEASREAYEAKGRALGASLLRDRVLRALEEATRRRSARVLATLLGEPEEAVEEVLRYLEWERVLTGKSTSGKAGRAYELRSRWEARRAPKKAAKKLRAPRPTKTIREAKPKMLDGYDTKTWAEGLHSVAGLINANGTTRGAWLLLHANPNTNVAAEVLDLLGQAGLVVPGETIKIGAVLQADLDAQPSARLSYLLTRRVGEWVCELVASSPKPPTVDALAKLTGLHRGLFCALLNALESEGRVQRSKGGGAPVWVVSAQDRTAALFEGVEPAPEREAAK